MIKTHYFRLENPDTGEVEDLWMDVELTESRGDSFTPSSIDWEILEWGKSEDDSKPDWILKPMLEKEIRNLENIDFDDDDSNYEDYEDYD